MSGTNLIPAQTHAANAPAAGGTAAAGTAPDGTAGDSPFDAILMLEELAAAATDTGIDVDASGLDAGAVDSTDETADDDETLELDNPLAFLAGLLAIAARPHPHVGAAVTGEGADALAASPTGDPGESGIPLLSDPGAGATNAKPDDAAAAARALAAQTALDALDSSGNDDKSTAARAVDMLTNTSRPAASTEHAPIATHARDPRWAEEFGTRIALLVNQRESVAAISLTPADLGPVDVSVTVRDSQATIHFGAAQAETRALIEASLPRLRELLAAQGFQLMDASVSQGFTRQSKPDVPSVPRPSNVEEVTGVETRAVMLNGLLDTYA